MSIRSLSIAAAVAAICHAAAIAGNPAIGVPVPDSASVARQGQLVQIAYSLPLDSVKVGANRTVVFEPVLINGADSITFPTVGIYGRNRLIHLERGSRRGDRRPRNRRQERRRHPPLLPDRPVARLGWTAPHSASAAPTTAAAPYRGRSLPPPRHPRDPPPLRARIPICAPRGRSGQEPPGDRTSIHRLPRQPHRDPPRLPPQHHRARQDPRHHRLG